VEPYGTVAVFVDVAGNRWDLLGTRVAHKPQEEAERRRGREEHTG
jgi:hypothetical protein